MKNISRENYEIWFVDYLDGKLDESSRQKLYAFLDDNPDLADELKSFEPIELEPEMVSFSPKSKLEKNEADFMDISSFDYLLVKQMEEGLDATENQELAEKIKENESLIRRGEEFQLMRLSPETISFPGKASLIHRKIGKGYVIAIRVASAAAVLLAAIWGYQNFLPQEQSNSLADLTPLESKSIPTEQPKIEDKHLVNASLTNIEEKIQDTKVNISEDEQPLSLKKQTDDNDADYDSKPEMARLASRTAKDLSFPVEIPSAYETGLRHMMPQYLDIHNRQQVLMADLQPKSSKKNENSFFVKGLKFVDRVSGDLVNFERLYDEEGNYVAYNLKAGNIEMKQKVKN